jgi:hypothetical protein
MANMGIAAGDYENNGHMDLVTTTFSDDYKVVFQNDGTGNFTDVSYKVGDCGSDHSLRWFWRRIP